MRKLVVVMKNTSTSRLLAVVAILLGIAWGNEGANAQTISQNPMEINVIIANKTFVADVEDTETGRAFVGRLPMTLDMSELNGNEKYYYLNESLPTNAQHYGTIEAGDLMLYGSSCVVLFYGKAGGYSYTRLGKLRQTEGLASAVGRGSVTVTFERTATDIGKVASPAGGTGTARSLSGVALGEKPAKGVYIKNGKKVVK